MTADIESVVITKTPTPGADYTRRRLTTIDPFSRKGNHGFAYCNYRDCQLHTPQRTLFRCVPFTYSCRGIGLRASLEGDFGRTALRKLRRLRLVGGGVVLAVLVVSSGAHD